MKGLNRGIFLFFLTVYLTVFCLAGCRFSQSEQDSADFGTQNELTTEERAEGWILLFDGETLKGWEDPAVESPPGHAWIVENGCIKGIDDPILREDLFTREQFGDFDLLFEWKISQGGNSGVKYRIQDRALLVEGQTDPEAKRFEDTVDYELKNRISDRSRIDPEDEIEEYTVAFEYQLIDDTGHPDAHKSMDRRAGAVYGLVAASEEAARRVGEFNQSRIRLSGNQVEHWLNGKMVVSIDLESDQIRTGLKRRWGIESPVYHLLTELPKKESPIALQHHDDEVWFRNLKIRRLE